MAKLIELLSPSKNAIKSVESESAICSLGYYTLGLLEYSLITGMTCASLGALVAGGVSGNYKTALAGAFYLGFGGTIFGLVIQAKESIEMLFLKKYNPQVYQQRIREINDTSLN